MAERVRVLLTEEEVDARIQEIGEQISKDYAGKQVHLLCVLKGGSFFMSMPVNLSAPSHFFFLVSSPYEDAPEYSATATPVHLNFKNPFTSRKYLVSL